MSRQEIPDLVATGTSPSHGPRRTAGRSPLRRSRGHSGARRSFPRAPARLTWTGRRLRSCLAAGRWSTTRSASWWPSRSASSARAESTSLPQPLPTRPGQPAGVRGRTRRAVGSPKMPSTRRLPRVRSQAAVVARHRGLPVANQTGVAAVQARVFSRRWTSTTTVLALAKPRNWLININANNLPVRFTLIYGRVLAILTLLIKCKICQKRELLTTPWTP